MGTVSPLNYYYGIPQQDDAKFNTNLPLREPPTVENTNDETNVSWVTLGDDEKIDDDESTRDLYQLYFSSKNNIDREPYIPDFSFNISNTHNTGMKLSIRYLIYGLSCIVKCNVMINPSDKETQKILTANDKNNWYYARQLSPITLDKLLLEIFDASNKQAAYISAAGDFLTNLVKFLTKNDQMQENSHWILAADDIHYKMGGSDGMDGWYGPWRHRDDARDQFENMYNSFMFNLLNYIGVDECLCTLTSIAYVATRIINILKSKEDELDENDSRLIVQCVELILQIVDKGDICALHQSFMSLPGYILDYESNDELKDTLDAVNNSTQALLDAVRALGNLGGFNFVHLVKHRRLHRIWHVFWMYSILFIASASLTLQNCLKCLMEHVQLIPQQQQFGM